MYDGDAAAAERLLRPLFEAAGPPLEEGMRSVPYAEAAMGGTPPRQVELLDELTDAAIEAITGARRRSRLGMAADAPTVEVRHWGGAIASPTPGTGPIGRPRDRLSVIADARVPELAAHATGGSFLNFLADTSRTASAFTPADLRRLRAVKRAYDPANLLRVGHTI